ncbi:DUF4444 domain-containing protein [Rhodovulum sp. DZ06]|uniref:biotin/lipoate--protein ligase family protein n=1 Tax=Rhodovulum sp. DZ06 TaxID=3425126 RepID=UPI003D34224E
MLEAEADPVFPPLMQGKRVAAGADPMLKACAEAAMGCDSGLICWAAGEDALRAALVLAPETPLEEAMAALPVCGVALQNALGALAPPEVSVHLEWSGGIRVNGAGCGRLRVAASGADPAAEPDWLVVGLELPLIPPSIDAPGETPDQTALYLEGCADVSPIRLLESWSRHVLHHLSRLEDDGGRAALHRDWRGLAWAMGEEVSPVPGAAGTFLGVDENFGMLLRPEGGETRLIPLSACLEKD